jgi:hypothetical protein
MIIWRNLDQKVMGQLLAEAGRVFVRWRRNTRKKRPRPYRSDGRSEGQCKRDARRERDPEMGKAWCAHAAALPAERTHRPRRKLWQVDAGALCSVVGTCLTVGDLKRIAAKAKVAIPASAEDYKIHGNFVTWAGRAGPIAKLMHKTLDRRYHASIRRFDAASDAARLMTLWNAHLQDSDIPGPYWATLTHPAATPDITSAAFGRVHMLSHLVGAANRADIRRLVVLELERDRLADELSKTKRRLAEQNREFGGAAEQQTKTIRDLTGQLEAARAVAARLRQSRRLLARQEPL